MRITSDVILFALNVGTFVVQTVLKFPMGIPTGSPSRVFMEAVISLLILRCPIGVHEERSVAGFSGNCRDFPSLGGEVRTLPLGGDSGNCRVSTIIMTGRVST